MTLADLKKVLQRFVTDRAGEPRESAERDIGELLNYMVRLADKQGVNLVSTAQEDPSEGGQRKREGKGRSAIRRPKART